LCGVSTEEEEHAGGGNGGVWGGEAFLRPLAVSAPELMQPRAVSQGSMCGVSTWEEHTREHK